MTARAVAPLDRLAGWCLPLVAPGGSLLALKGDRADEELAAAVPSLRRLGAAEWSVEEHGVAARSTRRCGSSGSSPARAGRTRSSTTVTVAWCRTAPAA